MSFYKEGNKYAVSDGTKKHPILQELGVNVLAVCSENVLLSPSSRNLVHTKLFTGEQFILTARTLKKVVDEGEAWFNDMTGTSAWGDYNLGLLTYTAGVSAAKAGFVYMELQNYGITDALEGEALVMDWHMVHGLGRPQIIENKPHSAIYASIDRMYDAYLMGEDIYSSYAATALDCHRRRLTTIEVLILQGKLNRKIPFNRIAETMYEGRNSYPAGLEILDSRRDGLMIGPENDRFPFLVRKYHTDNLPEEWLEYILPGKFTEAARNGIIIPANLLVATQIGEVKISVNGGAETRKIFMGGFENIL